MYTSMKKAFDMFELCGISKVHVHLQNTISKVHVHLQTSFLKYMCTYKHRSLKTC